MIRIPVSPMLATLSDGIVVGPQWVYEEKYDGIRTLAAKRGGAVRLWSRTLKDLTDDFALVTKSVAALPAPDVILDGEVVVLDEAGVSRFQLLQRRGGGGKLVFAVFDLLELGGASLLRLPLRERRALLDRLIARPRAAIVRSRRLVRDGRAAYAEAGELGWEGIIAKDEGSRYEPGKRTGAWLKVKIRKQSEFVIGGFTPPEGSRAEFGSLVLGMFDGTALRYVGRVGTGFSGEILRDLAARMRPLVVARSPFDPVPKDVRHATWVRPRLVAQVAYAEWTADGRLRQPAYLGLRSDKSPAQVRWEDREP